jgi:CheY-like chemotaxis protein
MPAADFQPRRILIVDDDRDARDALSEFLHASGYLVSCAENGKAALDEIQSQKNLPSLILLDLAMPVMDGDTFIDYARHDRRLKDIPIVVTSGCPPENRPGAVPIIAKPIRPERLLPLVRRFVQ